MSGSSIIAISGQLATSKRMVTVANNIANVNTVGFRATETKFSTVIEGVRSDRVGFASDGKEYVNVTSGGLQETGNPLDFALNGDGWFALDTSAGVAVTRDGRLQIRADGQLVSQSGLPILDPGGAPIQLNPAAGPIEVSGDGFIRQDGQQVGSIGVFSFVPPADFVRHGDVGILAGELPDAVIDDPNINIVQGFVEMSNVDAVSQMVELISVQRAFEQANTILKANSESRSMLIKLFGGG